MKQIITHEWPKRWAEAVRIQRELIKPRIDLYGSTPDEGLALGVECAYWEAARKVYCVAVLMRYPGFTELERATSEDDTPFPINAEIASFREGRAICKALEQITTTPDLMMIHGEGINAPSGVGVASHIGALFDIPSIGCCRRLRHGDRPRVPHVKGGQAKLIIEGHEAGVLVRTKADTKSIVVSPGYKISHEDALKKVVVMVRGFRSPEPIRVPHLLVMRVKSQAVKDAPELAQRKR